MQYIIFKDDKYGVWLVNKNKEVILIDREVASGDRLDIYEYLTKEGIAEVAASSVAEKVAKYKKSVVSIGVNRMADIL